MREANIHADEVQRILEARAAELARVEDDAESADALGVVVFRLSREWYAFSLADVREIHCDFVATRLPGVPRHVVGVVNVRGEILLAVDPARLLGDHEQASRQPGPCAAGIIVEAGRRAAVVCVDEVGDILEVSADALEHPLGAAQGESAGVVTASVMLDARPVGLLDAVQTLGRLGLTD